MIESWHIAKRSGNLRLPGAPGARRRRLRAVARRWMTILTTSGMRW
jgi:hypothetical protein